jgi:hypothetical protein
MPQPTIVKPVLNTDPGFLYYAPLATTVPTMTALGSVYTDVWTAPWVWLGMTTAGSTWHYNLATSPVAAAESIPDIAYRTTGATAAVDFGLLSYTATNLSFALNGAVKTMTGTAGTTSTKVTPPLAGQEVRFMLGWESIGGDVRKIAYQCINSGDIAEQFQKAPAATVIPFTVQCELPSLIAVPFETWFAGTVRG